MNSKLRFYLRGLGIGMFVTALILSIINLNKKINTSMTDAEVIARATELGMVNGNSYSLTDAVVGDKTNQTDDATNLGTDKMETEDSVADNLEAGNSDIESSQTENSENENLENPDSELQGLEAQGPEGSETTGNASEDTAPETPQSGETGAETQTPETVEEVGGETENSTQEAVESETPRTGTASITIRAGSGSETAAALIQQAGIVEDANDFNAYMCRNGYDRTVHVGTFEIPFGASYEEICKIIAG